MVRVALAGLGGMGKTHMASYKKCRGAKLLFVCDPEEQRVKEEAYESGAKGYTDFELLLENEEFDMVDLCVPNFLHKTMALSAIAHKKGVLCEKPLALSYADAKEITDAAEKAGVPLMTAQVIRFWPQYELLADIIRDRRYGELLHANFSRLGSSPGWTWNNWMHDHSKSGSVLFDLNIHDIDYANSIFGLPAKITANRAYCGETSMCYVNTLLKYESGMYVQTEASWYGHYNYPFGMEFRAAFQKGVVEMEPDGEMTAYTENGPAVLMSANETEHIKYTNIYNTAGYHREIEYFVDCVSKGISDPPLCAHESVLNTMKLIELENESIENGGAELNLRA